MAQRICRWRRWRHCMGKFKDSLHPATINYQVGNSDFGRYFNTNFRFSISRNHLSRASPPKARRQLLRSTTYTLSPPPPSTPSFSSSYVPEDSPPPSPTPARRRKLETSSKLQIVAGSRAVEAEESLQLDPLEEIRKKIDSATVKGFSSKYSLREHQRIARLFMMRCESSQYKGGLLLDVRTQGMCI